MRQGLGPFVARDLAAAGIEVGAVLGTGPESARAAADDLVAVLGEAPRAYTDLDRLLRDEAPDALAILSPSRTHEGYLRAALEAGVHVLCEKPLIWGGAELAARARRITAGFRERGLLLFENCQWPCALDAFFALHPDAARDAPPERFWMLLSPVSAGIEVLGDSFPHPLSLLQALVPRADLRLESLRLDGSGSDTRDLGVRFELRAGTARPIECHVELRHAAESPRPAAIGLDGRVAQRRISMPDYSFELVDGERSVALPDPLTTHLRDFAGQLGRVLAGEPVPDPRPSATRMALLEQVAGAFERQRWPA